MRSYIYQSQSLGCLGYVGQPVLQLRQPAGPQITWLVTLVFVGSGCPQSLCWVFKDRSCFLQLFFFIEKIQSHHIKNR